jgi:tRNA(fMet)-specific endonuclease VapC
MFMLDTDVLIAIIRGDKKLAGKLGEFQDFEIAISSIVEMEFRVGLAGLEGDSARYLRAAKLLEALRVYQFDSTAATTAANLRQALGKLGKPTGKYDLLIGAHAVAMNRVLVTGNIKHYQNMPGLMLDSWL